MKNFGKLISLLLCVATILSILSFVSCSDSSVDDQNDDKDEVDDTKYSVAVSLFGNPYVYSVEDKVSGICVDILAKIAEKNDEDLELKIVDSNDAIAGLVKNEYAAVLAPADTYIDEESAKSVVPSQILVSNKFVLLVSGSSRIYRLYDLAIQSSKKVGILEGSVAMQNAVVRFGEDNVITYSDYETGVEAVKNGEIDAIIVDEHNDKIVNDTYVSENGLRLLSDEYYSVDFVVFVKDTSSGILAKTNSAIAALEGEKKIEAIVNEYILGDGAEN